jgi:hypothetical protein
MKFATLTLAVALLGACAPYPPYAPPYGPPGPVEPYPPYPGAPAADACGAGRYAWLVGRSHAELPPRPIGANWRVAAQGDAMTRDLRPDRLNIIYDRHTHRVLQVYCG